MERYLSCLPRFLSDFGLGWLSITVAVVEALEVALRVGDRGACIVDGSDMLDVGMMMVKVVDGKTGQRAATLSMIKPDIGVCGEPHFL